MIRGDIRRAFRLALRRRELWEREVDDEIRFHVELRAEQLVREGWSPERARAEAVRRFGALTEARARLIEAARQREVHMRSTEWLDTTLQDVRYALRQLWHAPGFAAAAIVTLALGIGANATMFGIIDRLLLQPPVHVADPARLGLVTMRFRGSDGVDFTQQTLTYPVYTDLLAAGAYDRVTAYSRNELTLGAGAEARKLRGMSVTASYFATLGVRPLLGRFFLPEEDAAPAPEVVVLGYGFWHRQFDGDPSVIGHTLSIGGNSYLVIGVAPERFTGVDQSEVDAWVPLTAGVSAKAHSNWLQARDAYWLRMAARPKPGVSLDQAAAMATVTLRANALRDGWSAERIERQKPRVELISALPRYARADDQSSKVSVLLGAVSLLVLLLACANVANLQLARGMRRRREIAIRIALGVSRGRLLRQLVLESVLLAVAGGVAALLVAQWGGTLVRRLLFRDIDWVDAPVDGRVLLYTALAALATGVVTGLLPALQVSHPELTGALKEGAREARAHRSKTRLALLLVQAALTVVLLVGTGLFVRSLGRIEAVPTGMEPERVLVASVRAAGRSDTPKEIAARAERLEEVARTAPGVESAALGLSIPFWSSYGDRVTVPGLDSVPVTADGGPYFNGVTPDFFRTMGMRVLRGRGFTLADRDRHVVVVNETLARMWWPKQDAIGRCMKIGADTMPCSEVIGIVGNARRQSLVEEESVQFFVPIQRAPFWAQDRVLFIRPAGDARRAMERVRRVLQSSAPDLPYVDVRPLGDFVSPQTQSWRLGASMFGAFGALALLLAAVGLYGVLAYDVTQRTRELGVRIALGAQRLDVARMIVLEGMRVALLGGTIGILIALASGRFVEPLLFRTSPRDPAVFAAVALVVAVVALVATAFPAHRAVKVDPIVAMRTD